MNNRFFIYGLIMPMVIILFAGGISSAADTRPAANAGSFYPSSEDQLHQTVRALLDNSPDYAPKGEIFAAVTPHAGYVYSGTIAAHTYKQLAHIDFDTIVIIGHEYPYEDYVAFLSPADYFETPLGLVEVDRDMIEKMLKFNRHIVSNASIHSQDHSIEVQLPFLQVLGKKCKIVPVIFGNSTVKNCRVMTEAIIAAAGDKKVFVLASSDMSHYPSYESANKVDESTLEELKKMDINALFSHLENQERLKVPGLETAMCARGGVGTAILFAKTHGATNAQILKYANSGDVSLGGKDSVVGYSSVLFIKTYPVFSK